MKSKRTWSLAAMAAGAVLAAALPVLGSAIDVKLKLPQRARLDLQGRKSVAITPFIIVTQEGEGKVQGRDFDVQKEFDRYLNKVLKRETDLKVIDAGPIDFPVYDLEQLTHQTDF